MALLRGLPKAYDPLIRLYLLRLLVHMDAFRLIVDDRRVQTPWVLRAAGVGAEEETPDCDPKAVLRALRTRLEETEDQTPSPPESAVLTQNVAWLGRTLDLTQVQSDIVLFLALAHHSAPLGKLLEKFGQIRTHEAQSIIATGIGHPIDQVSTALLHTGRLIKSGLVTSDLANRWGFETKITLLTGIPDQLTLEHADPHELFLSNFLRSGPPALGLGDFPHLTEDIKVLDPYLRHALSTRATGVNILVFGPPGTGKTELVKSIAEHLGAPLYEIAVEDRHGTVHKGDARFGAYQLAQGVLGGERRPLVLFDEIEDVFTAQEDGDKRFAPGNRSGRKGWVNRLLQENPIPSFWITNIRAVLDPAFIRRFDFALELGIPPRSVRAQVLDRYLADTPVTSGWKAMIAEHDALSPAGIERAAKVTRRILENHPGADPDAVVDRVLGNSLEALGSPRHPRTMPPSATTYRLDVLNTDRDLSSICEGLKRTGSGRLCAWGPPGTGKSAFGHHLAKVLDRPLIVKRASDLQSKWLGETEQNMARMFQDATADNAVLLLDEADSFLQDRRGAERSWEVSQTNEMLCQLESFQGVFIASTNLMESLDQASLRRFDLKVKFDYLRREQSVTMFRDSLTLLGLQPDPNAERRVGSLRNLTPGDVAAALRQAQLSGASTAMAFAEMLVGECVIKVGGPRRGIGFQPPVVVH